MSCHDLQRSICSSISGFNRMSCHDLQVWVAPQIFKGAKTFNRGAKVSLSDRGLAYSNLELWSSSTAFNVTISYYLELVHLA